LSEHEAAGDKPREIGLKAIHDARVERGRSKHGRISGTAALVAGLAVVSIVVASWQYREHSLSGQKDDLLAKQRAAQTTVGAAWTPLRDALEKTTLDAATGAYKGDFVDPEASKWDFRSLPGIYLRMRTEDAKDAASLRKKAKDSGRDGFVACLLRENNPTMAAIARGEDAGSPWQDQPWNLRLAYASTRVLDDDWATEVKNAEDEIHLRVFVQQYEKAKTEEIPLAVEIVTRAKFFLLALDEDVPEARDLAPDAGAGKPPKVTEEELEQVPHPVRVEILKLEATKPGQAPTAKEMVRLRREPEGGFRFAAGGGVRDPRMIAAVKRQVNNCELAQEVWSAVKGGEAPQPHGP
jgi:hypothetical protein